MLRVSGAFLGTLLLSASRASALFMSTTTSPSALHEADANRAVQDELGGSPASSRADGVGTEQPDVSRFLAQSRSIYELFGGPLRPVGFLNEGNQCYRNVLLQSLLTLPRFVDEILEHDVHTGTIVYSATAFQQIKGMIIAVAEGRASGSLG